MTDNNNKARALILTALMVFSVFAGTVALTGAAGAATASTWTANSSEDVVIGESSTTQDLTVDFSMDSGTENVTLDLSGYQDGIDFNSFSASTNNANVSVESENLDSSNDEYTFVLNNTNSASESGILTITADLDTQDASQNSGTSLTISANDAGSDAQFQFDVVDSSGNTGDVAVRKATHYVDDDDGEIVEVAFADSVNASGKTFTIGLDNGTTIDVTAQNGGDGRVVLPTGQVYSNVQNVTVPDSISDSGTVDVTFAPVTVDDDGATYDAYVGSKVAFEATSTESTISFKGPGISRTRGTGHGSQVYVLDTSGFDSGTYNATFPNSNVSQLELSELGLSVSADNATTDEAVTATVTADDIDREVDVMLMDSDDEVVDTKTVTIDADGEATADFGTQDAGDYTVEAEDVTTGVTASDTLTVTEAAEGGVEFTANSYSVAQGGIAEITLDLAGGATEGTLIVGQEDQSGYQANITFTDEDEDGEVTIQFNTYAAGNPSANIVDAAGDDTASVQSGSTDLEGNLLDEGGYDIAVDTGANQDGDDVFNSGSADFGALSIGPRSTDSMQLWTAPGSATGSDVFDATLTQDTTIAKNDWVIHQVSATGLGGLVDAKGNFSAALGDGLNVSVMQTEASTQANRQPKTLNLTASPSDAVQLWADSDNNSYYIALDTQTAVFDRGSKQVSAAAGDEFTATFTVDDTKLVGEDEEDHQSVNATFEVVERTASLDSTPVTAQAASNQTIAGSASVAPGTTFTVTIQSAGDTSPRFYKNPTATVQADGTWNVSVDFSEQSVGDTFTVKVSSYSIDADGEIVESTTETETVTETETETETETDTETETETETEAPDTETETDEPTDTETETSTTTPGFGVAVALVALLAAALLAGRRD